MAVYTASLSQNYKGLATYYASQVQYSTYSYTWQPTSITPPVWKSGRKTFECYSTYNARYDFDVVIVDSRGSTTSSISSNITASEKWTTLAPAITYKDGSSYIGELVYYEGVWYTDLANRTVFDSQHPMPLPSKELYRFVGMYSTNGTTGTKYVNADGTPTADFPTTITEDLVAYAVFEKASVKITISSSNGDYQYKAFYQSLTADANGKYGYYTDSACPASSRIYGIPVPTREQYAWGGLRESTGTSSELWANADGTFTDAFKNRSAETDTAYGDFWTKVSYKLTQYGSSGWTYQRQTYYIKIGGGVYADWLCPAGAELAKLPVPSKAGYRYIGSYSSNSTSGTLLVEGDGDITSTLREKTSDTTVYPQGRAASATVTLDDNGGTGGSGKVYYDATSGEEAFFNDTSAPVTSVTPPTYTGNTFDGYYDAQTGGTKRINADGTFVGGYSPSSSETLYAQWTIGKSIVEIDSGEGGGGTTRIYYDHTDGHFYADAELTEVITSVTLPTLRLFDTNGLYTDSVAGTQVADAAGVLSATFAPTEEYVTVYARYARRCCETVVDANGGTCGVAAIYRAPGGSTWYSDDALTTAVANVGVTSRTGYTFGGYYYAANQVIDASGAILGSAVSDDDYTAVAAWSANTYVLAFDYNGGTGQTASKTVTYGSAIGQLPTATRNGQKFEAWQVDGQDIKATDVWSIASNKTAVARWKDNFGGLTDWFGLSNNLIMIVGSESGEGRLVTNLWNGGIEQGPGLVNPVCTYRIKAKGNVTIRLGKAFKGGYFITGFEYRTGADKEPVLVVSGTANEGSDAINLYDVTFQVDPDHIAQDPFGAVVGGGELVELTSAATCDAVVPYENNRPCASDVVHGRKTVTGRTAAYFGENPPTFANSFLDGGTPKSESDVDFTTYAFAAERTI